MHAPRRLTVVPSALALLGAPVAASAAPPQAGGFTYTEIAVPGADYTAVTGINN
ncbi:MAG: hypothetical protein ACXV1K_10770 [Kineosporiaceae bacterium]